MLWIFETLPKVIWKREWPWNVKFSFSSSRNKWYIHPCDYENTMSQHIDLYFTGHYSFNALSKVYIDISRYVVPQVDCLIFHW